MSLVLLGLLALAPLDEAAPSCPTAADVEAALTRLGAGDQHVAIDDGGDAHQLRVRSLDAAGAPVHEWRLPRQGSCQELTDAAALAVAVWSGRLDDAQRPLAPALPEPAAAAPLALTRATPRPPRLAYEVAARFTIGWAPGGEATFGGAAELTLGPAGAAGGAARSGAVAPARSPFAARLTLGAQSLQRHALAIGQLEWTRPALGLGARGRLERAHLRFEAHAGALLALLVLGGSGFTSSQQSYDVDVGLEVGARAGYHVGHLTPFVDLHLAGWLRRETALVDGLGHGYDLPRIDLLASVGVAVDP